MEQPDGFEAWSEECRKAYRALREEWDARKAAEAEAARTRAAADAAETAVDSAEQRVEDAEDELAAIKKRAEDYVTNRRAAKRARDAADRAWKAARTTESNALNELQRLLSRRVRSREITFDAGKRAYQAEKAAATARVQALKAAFERAKAAHAALKTQRDADGPRRRQLEEEAPEQQRRVEAAEAAAAAAAEAAEAAAAGLAALRSAARIRADHVALVLRCGPQDPMPGGPSIPVPLGMVAPVRDGEPIADDPELETAHATDVDLVAELEAELASAEDGFDLFGGPGGFRLEGASDWQDGLAGYLLSLPPTISLATQLNRLAALDALPVDDELTEVEPDPTWVSPEAAAALREETGTVEIGDPPKKVWHEGCVEFLWVQGTTPAVSGELVSNPVTRTVAQAMADVNAIFAGCCVRFVAHLKIVTPEQLKPLWGARDGIQARRAGGASRVHAVSKEKIHPNLGAFIQALQDHKTCASFLVVDRIDGGAGFAGLGTKRGIVTMEAHGSDRLGDTTAHELGHAVGGIPHVVAKGKPGEKKHEHGELMWGEGCEDHPNSKAMRYAKVTAADCAAMRANTKATKDPCEDA